MRKFTFQDGSTLHISNSATVVTNHGPMLASAVTTGMFVRCGSRLFCRVDDIELS